MSRFIFPSPLLRATLLLALAVPCRASLSAQAAQAAPAQAQWDQDSKSGPQTLLDRQWPAGELKARLEVVSTAKPEAAAVPTTPTARAGSKAIEIVLRLSNPTEAGQRVLLSAVRALNGKSDSTARFWSLPLSSLPTTIPAHGEAEQRLRLDTFDDTPSGAYSLEPVVLAVPVADDLLANGGWEEATPKSWELAAGASVVDSAAPLSEASNQTSDWTDFSKLSFSNDRRTTTQGQKLLEANGEAVGSQTLGSLAPGERYVAGVDSWGGRRLRVDILDAASTSLASQERTFSGVWWMDNVGNWRGRVLGFQLPAKAVAVKLSLLGNAGKSWWDNAFLVREKDIRRAAFEAAPLSVAAPAAPEAPVKYLGEDTGTQGDWIGKYGQYASILCAMSSPRDMVGGAVKPIKSDRDLQKNYANETVHARSQAELRYSSWTANPGDPETRHWIELNAMRTDDRRALDNPQWGQRTYASWDEHGEMHPNDAKGNDLFVKLRLPPGQWRASFYFIDWDWWYTAVPRNHRLAFLDDAGRETCTARVTNFGQGIYKVFQVAGGRDVTMRIRKDFSVTVVLSGIFLDRISPQIEPQVQVAIPEVNAAQLQNAVQQWRQAASAVAGFDAEEKALRGYAQVLLQADRVQAASALEKLGDAWFAVGEYWRAGLAYDLMPRDPNLAEGDISEPEKRALQFRAVFPRYAQSKLRQALEVLAKLPPEDRLSDTRDLASSIFDAAIEDHSDSNGMERVPMLLAKTAYDDLEKQVGYANLKASERARLLAIAERSTWYSTGWSEVATEAQRFWPTLNEKQRAQLGPGFFADHVVRPLGVAAQKDNALFDKAIALVYALANAQPDAEATGFAQHALAEIYAQRGQADKARELCQAIIARGENSRPATLAKGLLKQLGGAK